MSTQYNDILADQIAEPVTSEENLELYKRVITGDTAARQEMIERNMALVISRVDSFVATRPSVRYLRDDLISAGSIGLVRAVNAMARGAKVDNPGGYMGTGINNEVVRLFETENPINIPQRSLHRAEDDGEAMTPLEQRSATYLEECPTSENTAGVVELRDLLESCCEDQVDRDIVRLREEGYTFPEMATQLDVPQTTVYRRFRQVHNRFVAKEAELRDQESLAAVSRNDAQLRFN